MSAASPTTAHASAERPLHEARAEQHEQAMEEREAVEAWGGYLFKPDKTGTDKLKSLLRGLKNVINEEYEPSDNPDLTPTQLASFYRDLSGNYDQLFLGTPGPSIAFIYKSLGCLHSLQPLSHSTAFTEPTVPALKTEGWIMWQTIQLLLGPDEHSAFLMDAVHKFDVKDPSTGHVFPKILPRSCFPMEPDKHMVAWYEGVSDRLRKEAEHEEQQRSELELDRPESAQSRLTVRPPETDDAASVMSAETMDSRGPAIAYFRNPLYRHVDGRPSIVRRGSKRPPLSPRQTMLDKGKAAAATLGNVARNVASPSLWSGHADHHHRHGSEHRHHSSSRHGDSRTGSHDRRRRSVPHAQFPGDLPPPERDGYDDRLDPHHARRRSSRSEPRPTSAGATEPYDEDEEAVGTPLYSPEPSPRPPQTRHHRPSSHASSHLRHSRSHEPTPTQREGDDYFAGPWHPANNNETSPTQRRRASVVESTPQAPAPSSYSASPPHPQAPPGFGPAFEQSFGPSASPLFASHIARQPPPANPTGALNRPYPSRAPPPSRHPPSISTYDSRSPSRNPDRGGRYDSPSQRGPPPPPSSFSGRSRSRDARFPPPGSSHDPRDFDGPPLGRIPSRSRRGDPRRSGEFGHDPRRRSGSDLDGYPPDDEGYGEEGRRSAGGKKTARFADLEAEQGVVKGVHGRRYPALGDRDRDRDRDGGRY